MDMINYSINYTILTFIINAEEAFSNLIIYITFKKTSHKKYLLD